MDKRELAILGLIDVVRYDANADMYISRHHETLMESLTHKENAEPVKDGEALAWLDKMCSVECMAMKLRKQ